MKTDQKILTDKLEIIAKFMDGKLMLHPEGFDAMGYRFPVAPEGRSAWWNKSALQYNVSWSWLIPVYSKWNCEFSKLHPLKRIPSKLRSLRYENYRNIIDKYVIENSVGSAFEYLYDAILWIKEVQDEISR